MNDISFEKANFADEANFANASFSLLGGKIQGTIIYYLMPPLSTL